MLTELKERRTVEPANTSSLLIATYEAFASYHSGALHQARFRLEQIVATRPDAAFARILLGRALLAIKDYARARVHFETILFPRAPFAARFEKFHADAIGGLAYVAAREGDRFGAAALRDDLARRFHDQFYAHALAATALGDETGAAHILQSAAAMHDPRTFFAGSDPLLAQSAALAASS
jgi:tetratricopeptide (TPR) repeat protein